MFATNEVQNVINLYMIIKQDLFKIINGESIKDCKALDCYYSVNGYYVLYYPVSDMKKAIARDERKILAKPFHDAIAIYKDLLTADVDNMLMLKNGKHINFNQLSIELMDNYKGVKVVFTYNYNYTAC